MSSALQVKLGIDGFRQPGPTPPSCPSTGHKNSAGLTPLGEFAIKEMMRHGMLVDIDHMSQFSAERALAIAEGVPAGGYPLMSGHNGLRGVGASIKLKTTERRRSSIASPRSTGCSGSAMEGTTLTRGSPTTGKRCPR